MFIKRGMRQAQAEELTWSGVVCVVCAAHGGREKMGKQLQRASSKRRAVTRWHQAIFKALHLIVQWLGSYSRLAEQVPWRQGHHAWPQPIAPAH